MNFQESLERYRKTQEIAQWWANRNKRGGTMSKSLTHFIRENRAEIDAAIKRVCDNCRLNDRERRLWVLNDEGLYNWARAEGVRI